MKNLTLLVLLTLISFSASAQLTFDWETQYISEGNNMKAMNIADDNTAILAGYGRTFKVSPDQGLTWNDVPLLDPEFDFADISINSSGLGYACAGDVKVIDNPSDGEPDVYADGVLLKTIDHGATWTLVDVTTIGSEEGPEENPNELGCYATHFRAVEVLEDNTVFLGAEWYFHESASAPKVGQKGVLKSTDGETWTSVVDSGYYPMAIEAATSSVYYGGLNNLFRAEAGSETVTDIYTALTDAAADLTVFVNDFEIVSEDLVYVVTSTNGIYVTEDQGASFTRLENGAPTGGNDMLLVNDSVWLVLGTSSKSMVTRDSGLTWEDCYPGSTCYEIGGILNDTVYGMGKSDLYKIAVAELIAGSYTWKTQTIVDGENLQKMHITDANTAIIAAYGQTLVSTSDAGLTWTAIETPELFVYGADYDYSSVSTSGAASYLTTRRMTIVDFPSASAHSDVYAHGLIYKSMDYWSSWELLDVANIGTGVDPVFNPNVEGCYGMSPTLISCVNDTIVYAYVTWFDTIAGFDNKLTHANVFLTEDGGDSWLPLLEDLGSSYVNDIKVMNKDNVYVIGNSIFRKTEDGGATFIDLYPALVATGSPNDNSLFLNEMVYVDEAKWYLPSSVDGIFVTEDGGANYRKLPGIGGGTAMMQLNDTSLIVLGSLAKSKISWDSGETWTGCYPGSSVWAIGGVLDGKLVALAKTNIYKIPIVDLEAPNTETDILSFVLAAQTGAATIDAVNHTISMELVSGTDPGALTPTITLSEGASIAPGSEVEQDFTNPVVYTVTAEDQEMKEAWTVTVSVAVNVMERKAEITLYPNPASEKLFLNNLEEVNSVSLFSISGSAVLSMETPSTKAELNLGDLENGIYFISFYGKEGSVSTQKFVINR